MTWPWGLMKKALKLHVLVTSAYSITSQIGLLYEIIQSTLCVAKDSLKS